MSAPTVDPPVASFEAAGGKSVHTISNPGGDRFAIKIKTSDNALYKVTPVFQFVEPGASATIEISRSAGGAKTDKLVVQYAPVAADLATPQEAFPAGGAFPELPVDLVAQ